MQKKTKKNKYWNMGKYWSWSFVCTQKYDESLIQTCMLCYYIIFLHVFCVLFFACLVYARESSHADNKQGVLAQTWWRILHFLKDADCDFSYVRCDNCCCTFVQFFFYFFLFGVKLVSHEYRDGRDDTIGYNVVVQLVANT